MDSLLKNATRVLSEPIEKRFFPVLWLSDSRLLVQDRQGGTRDSAITATLDLPGERLTLQRPWPRLGGGALSPNQQWVLGSPPGSRDAVAFSALDALSLSGQPTRRWSLKKTEPDLVFKGSDALWLPNGSAWLCLAYYPGLKGRQLYLLVGKWNESPTLRVLPLGTEPDPTGQRDDLYDYAPLGQLLASPDNDLIQGIRFVQNRQTQRLMLCRWEVRLSHGLLSQRLVPLTTPFPKGESLHDLAYSPLRQRLAAITASPSGQHYTLYTLRPDGSQLTALGALDTVALPRRRLQWLPSGTRLSFEHNNSLWLLPDTAPSTH